MNERQDEKQPANIKEKADSHHPCQCVLTANACSFCLRRSLLAHLKYILKIDIDDQSRSSLSINKRDPLKSIVY